MYSEGVQLHAVLYYIIYSVHFDLFHVFDLAPFVLIPLQIITTLLTVMRGNDTLFSLYCIFCKKNAGCGLGLLDDHQLFAAFSFIRMYSNEIWFTPERVHTIRMDWKRYCRQTVLL